MVRTCEIILWQNKVMTYLFAPLRVSAEGEMFHVCELVYSYNALIALKTTN